MPKGLIPGDIFFDNVLFRNENIQAIIDFVEACHYYFVFDLGMSTLGLCRTDGEIDLTKTRALIEGYQQKRPCEFLEGEFFTIIYRICGYLYFLVRILEMQYTFTKPKIKS